MIMERGARPDALPNPPAKSKRGKTALAVVVVGVVALAFGLGFGAGAHLNAAIERWAPGSRAALPRERPALPARDAQAARDRWRDCSMTDAEADPVPTPEELVAMLARWRARGAEPKWGTP
jgi:hypothetical protein